MILLQEDTALNLISKDNQMIRALVSEMSYGLTIEKAMSAPKIFQVKKKIGFPNLLKLMSVIIKSFCDSIKAKHTMDPIDVLDCSELICEVFTHDSVKDVVMALKQAKLRGHKFHHQINSAIILEILNTYMGKKSEYIESREADAKSAYTGVTRTEAYTKSVDADMHYDRRKELTEMKELSLIQQEKKEIKNLKNTIEKAINSKIPNDPGANP